MIALPFLWVDRPLYVIQSCVDLRLSQKNLLEHEVDAAQFLIGRCAHRCHADLLIKHINIRLVHCDVPPV